MKLIGIISSFQLKSTKQLLGRAGERFLLFGMLVHSKEGKLCLEDLDGVVELDFLQLVRSDFSSYFANLERTGLKFELDNLFFSQTRINRAKVSSLRAHLPSWRVITRRMQHSA